MGAQRRRRPHRPLTFALGFAALGLGGGLYPPLGEHPEWHAALVGLGAFVPLAISGWWRLRTSPRVVRVLGPIAALGILGCPALAYGGMLLINGVFHREVRTQQVVMVRMLESHEDNSYVVLLEPWPPHASAIECEVDADAYALLQRGPQRMRIGVGAFAFEYFAGWASEER